MSITQSYNPGSTFYLKLCICEHVIYALTQKILFVIHLYNWSYYADNARLYLLMMSHSHCQGKGSKMPASPNFTWSRQFPPIKLCSCCKWLLNWR